MMLDRRPAVFLVPLDFLPATSKVLCGLKFCKHGHDGDFQPG